MVGGIPNRTQSKQRRTSKRVSWKVLYSLHPYTCETSGMVAANTATDAALYWFFGARDSRGPRDLHAVRPKLVAGLTANTACTCSGLSLSSHRTSKQSKEKHVMREDRRGGVNPREHWCQIVWAGERGPCKIQLAEPAAASVSV